MSQPPGDDSVLVMQDARLLLPAVVTWAAVLLTLGRPAAPVLVVAGALGLLALTAGATARLAAQSGQGLAVLAAVLLCAAGGTAAVGLRAAARAQGPVRQLARTHAVVTVDLTLLGDPKRHDGKVVGSRRLPDSVLATARVDRVSAAGTPPVRVRVPVLVVADDPAWLGLLPSQPVQASGRLLPPRPGDLTAGLLTVRGAPRVLGPASHVQRTAGRLRQGLRDAAAGLPADERGLLPGLVDGDTGGLPPDVADDFRTTGLTHLVAVSGSNVAVVLAAALALAARSGLGRRLRLVAAGLALLGFVVLARPDPSVLRAAVMGGIGLVAAASGRPRASLPVLSAALLGLLLLDPALARSAGFALSTLATAGLVLLAPSWRDRLAQHLPRRLAEALAVPLAAQLACGPVIAAIAASVSLVAVPANLLAEPAVAPATVAGVVAAMLAPLSPTAARVAAHVAALPCWWLVHVARLGSRLPAASLPWPDGLRGALLLAGGSVLAVAVVRRRRLRRPVAVLLVGTILAVVVAHRVQPGWAPAGWQFAACDVGQGDGLVLSTGGGTAVLVDTGPDPAAELSCLSGLGVRRVAEVVITHLHADHVDGLQGVLLRYHPAVVEIGPFDQPSDERDRLGRWARAAGVPVRDTGAGDERVVGGLRWDVLGPRRLLHGTDSDPNNNSLVIRATWAGLTVLLTGDVETEAQQAELDDGEDLHADVLKVPHHGSDKQVAEYLARVGARLSVTSVGAGNPYGHPSPATMARLGQDGMRTMRTDRDGTVVVTGAAGAVSVLAKHGSGTPSPPGALARAGVASQPVVAALGTPAASRGSGGPQGSGRPPGSRRRCSCRRRLRHRDKAGVRGRIGRCLLRLAPTAPPRRWCP